MPIISPTRIRQLETFYDKKVLSSKFLTKHVYDPAIADPAKFAGKMALVSALTKDAVGCYYYVSQTLKNDKIPEEKRNFVAALDLMNGILNVALQFTVGMWIDKKAPEWFDKTLGKSLDTDETIKTTKEVHSTMMKEAQAKMAKGPQFKIVKKARSKVAKINLPDIPLLKDVEAFLRDSVLGSKGKATKLLKVGFTAASVLIATQVITKRVLVPFLATPLAGWYKDNYMDKKKPKAQGQTMNNKDAQRADYAQLNASRFLDKKAFEQFTKNK